MDTAAHVVIVGAGHAGGTAAGLLRQYGFDGHITLVGDEGELPYQRPPLSKAWLKAEVNVEDLYLRPASFYEQNEILLHLDEKAQRIDPQRRRLHLSGDKTLAYDRLILATGAHAHRLQVAHGDSKGVVYLRDMRHAAALKDWLAGARRMAVLGGGYVGLEVAATARQLGGDVLVIERESRLLARVASTPVSDFVRGLHQREGVEFRFGASVSALVARQGRLAALVLDDGERIECDPLLVGIGAVPNDELAREAGLVCEQGIVVDEASRTTHPHIYAIGDVSRRRASANELAPRVESVSNALDQARQAASAIAGRTVPAAKTPWFWSDQYAAKLQSVGLPKPTDTTIVRPSASGTSLAGASPARQGVARRRNGQQCARLSFGQAGHRIGMRRGPTGTRQRGHAAVRLAELNQRSRRVTPARGEEWQGSPTSNSRASPTLSKSKTAGAS